MFGKAQIENSVWKRENKEFQCLEKGKSKFQCLEKLAFTLWNTLLFDIRNSCSVFLKET